MGAGFLGAMEGFGTGVSQVADMWMQEAKQQRIAERQDKRKIAAEERAEKRGISAEERAEKRGISAEERAEKRGIDAERRGDRRKIAAEWRAEGRALGKEWRGREEKSIAFKREKALAKYKQDLRKIERSAGPESAKGGDYIDLYQTAIVEGIISPDVDMVTWLKERGVSQQGIDAAVGAKSTQGPAKGTNRPGSGQVFTPQEGQRVRGPDGKLYVVKGGEPVPVEEEGVPRKPAFERIRGNW